MEDERYAELLAKARPVVIGTPEEHDRMLSLAEDLMDKGEALGPEETKLLELLVVLIRTFEDQVESEEDGAEEEASDGDAPLPQPYETLRRLMDSRGWDDQRLTDVFGNPRLVAEVMHGRRPISKGQAKELGRLFQVPAKLFVS